MASRSPGVKPCTLHFTLAAGRFRVQGVLGSVCMSLASSVWKCTQPTQGVVAGSTFRYDNDNLFIPCIHISVYIGWLEE